jgi:hypothetical protein
MAINLQITWLFLLSIPIGCIAWTVTHEEVFREPRNYCGERCKNGKTILERKFFYLFTCEYCFSHYVTLCFLFITEYKLLAEGWQGYIISEFALVWVANVYMGIFALIRQNIKKEKAEIAIMEKNVDLKR